VTDFRGLLRALSDAGVECILVGGVAATAHGSSRLTLDLDLVYRRSPENIERLGAPLAPLHPYLPGAPPGLPFRWDARTIRQGLNFTLNTDLGDLDLLGEIVGGGGFDHLAARTMVIRVFGMECRCLDLDTLIHVKRAAGRTKDLEATAELEAIRGERGGAGEAG